MTERPSRFPFKWRLATILIVLVVIGLVMTYLRMNIAVTPPQRKVANAPISSSPAFDLWGEDISREDAERMLQTPEGRVRLSATNGAVAITPDLLKLGEKTFYEETFGNEVVATDILGMLDGPLTRAQFTKAIAALRGGHTTNLRLELAKDANVGGRFFRKGDVIDTGIDVPRGSITPLGFAIRQVNGRPGVGLACAACHSTVDAKTGDVMHGVPNGDLRSGLLAALAPNTASFVAHADFQDVSKFVKNPQRTIVGSKGQPIPLPDPELLEQAVDAALLKWPPGSFDSMIDLQGDPTQVPSSFTRGAHPYGWSGFASIGPFYGLSALNNNVHGLNSDPFTSMEGSPVLFGWDKELYIAMILQNSSNPKFRFDPAKHGKPSEFLKSIDPTPQGPAVNELVASPVFPMGSMLTPDGLLVSSKGRKVWEQVHAMSAWQNTLVPPKPPIRTDAQMLAIGRRVFEQARCNTCHSGPALSSPRLIPAPEIGTEPVRAKAFARTAAMFTNALGYAWDEEVPLRDGARTLVVPTNNLAREQAPLAYGWGDSPGGYKIMHLVGLYWTAPYLHDGGVAAGTNVTAQVGVPGTLLQNIPADPFNSLRALVDRKLRERVLASNAANADLAAMNVRGGGHAFWIDTDSGFSAEEQRALLLFVLTYEPPWATQRQSANGRQR